MFKKYLTALAAADRPAQPVVTKDVTTTSSTIVQTPQNVLTIGPGQPTYRTETMHYTGTAVENRNLNQVPDEKGR